MARGGKRQGAGRKKGSKSAETVARETRAKEVAAKALAEGVTPLDVMLGAMREAYEQGGYLVAAAYAKEAAPYVHPKLSSIEAKVDNTNRDAAELSDADLTDIASGSSQRAPGTTPRTQ